MKKGIYVKVPIPLLRRIEEYAKREGITISEAARLLLREGLRRIAQEEAVIVCG